MRGKQADQVWLLRLMSLPLAAKGIKIHSYPSFEQHIAGYMRDEWHVEGLRLPYETDRDARRLA